MIAHRPYPTSKDSGVNSIGAIPAHWRTISLGKLGRFSASGIDKKTVAGETTVQMVNYTDVYSNRLKTLDSSIEYMLTTCPNWKAMEHSLREGDMLFTPSSETADEIGYSAVVTERLLNTVYSYHLIRFRPYADAGLTIGFCKYLGNNQAVLTQFTEACKGTTRQILTREDFKSVIVTLPPVEEQARITDFLDRETAKIDALIEKKLRLIELLKEKRAALITQAVTRGLNPNVPMKDSGVEWLGKIPAHWEVKRLRHLGEAIIGLTYKPEDVVESAEGVLVLRASNVNDGQVVYGDNVFVRNAIPEHLYTRLGDILICARSGSRDLIGKSARIPADAVGLTFGAFMIVFRSSCNPFLFHVFNSALFEYQSGTFLTSTINQLTISNIKDMAVPVALGNESAAIVSFLDLQTTKVDALVLKIQEVIMKFREYRAALVFAAATGKIDIRGL